MGRKKQDAETDGTFVIQDAEKLFDRMKELADRNAAAEPIMLQLARIAGFTRVERHIMNVRKIVATRRQE